MKLSGKAIILIFFAFLLSSTVAYAADDSWDRWLWDCLAFTNITGGDRLLYGVGPNCSDGYDDEHTTHDNDSPVHAGIYYENGVDGWTGPTGFYAEDYRSPVSLVPGSSKSWLINVWADQSFDSSVSFFSFSARINGILPPRDFRYTLTLLRKPAGVEGGPAEGTTYDMSYYTFNWAAVFDLPAYRTTDGRSGYLIELKATAVPEPSSLITLVAGLASIGGFILKRKCA